MIAHKEIPRCDNHADLPTKTCYSTETSGEGKENDKEAGAGGSSFPTLNDALNVSERRKAEPELTGELPLSLAWLRRPHRGMANTQSVREHPGWAQAGGLETLRNGKV